MRKWSILLLAAVLTVFLCACGGAAEDGTQSPAPAVSDTGTDVPMPSGAPDAAGTTPVTDEGAAPSATVDSGAANTDVGGTARPENTPVAGVSAAPSPSPVPSPDVTPPASAEPDDEHMGTISEAEAVRLLQDYYGTADTATGNTYTWGLEDTIELNGEKYYNFRWSWLVADEDGGGHSSYLTNVAVSLDGTMIMELQRGADGEWEPVW